MQFDCPFVPTPCSPPVVCGFFGSITKVCVLKFLRGYGFVRFSDEGDMMRALQDCQNAPGLGGKRIRLTLGISKR